MTDRWGTFASLAGSLPKDALVLVDARVGDLHRLNLKGRRVLPLQAGEQAKSLRTLQRVLEAGATLPRSGVVVCIGGGTLGDVATVAAHLIKRGVGLIHVPTTALAAVDSSLGGKGAIHVGGIKNAAGVFHFPDEVWLCSELWETLSPKQLREGAIEAWKMALTLDARRWRRWVRRRPSLVEMVRAGRAMKARVCRKDPFDRTGARAVLNFGHTFGHVIESVTRFRVSHGDAVGLGMLCALDLGTPRPLAREVEEALQEGPGVGTRVDLARALRGVPTARIEALVAADKKDGAMVLLQGIGRASVRRVKASAWKRLLPAWRSP